MRPLRTSLALCLLGLLPGLARAEPLRIDRSAERLRVDGALPEWRGAQFRELGSGEDASVRYALASTDEGLYLGAEVRDARIVTAEPGDALVLTLVMPRDEQPPLACEYWLHPGAAGKKRARGLVSCAGGRKQLEAQIKVVEGPRAAGAGYLLEAFLPWTLVSGDGFWEQGRGSLRLVDVDGPKPPVRVASAEAARPIDLPRLSPGEGQRDLLGSFFQAQQLPWSEPRFDFRANVAGDPRKERVAIIDRFVVVYGPGYKGGESYSYFALPYGLGGALKHAELRELTHDGLLELVVTVRQQNDLGARDLWVVLSIDEATMRPLFQVELKKELKGGTLENTLSIHPQGERPPRIELAVGRASGLDANTYREESAREAEPLLLPWGEIAARSYAWDGARFARIDERQRAVPLTAPSVAIKAQVKSPEGERAAAPEQLFALFKEQQKLPAGAKPSRTFRADVVLGPGPERIDLFGSVLLLTGPELAGGTSYLAYSLPVAAASDVLSVESADVTGDQKQELLVRARQQLVGAEGVVRELLTVLRGDSQGKLARVLTVEVARRQARSFVLNTLHTEGGALTIEPGIARGWSQHSYPFQPDPVGAAGALLLPWRDRPLRYRLEGAQLVAYSQ